MEKYSDSTLIMTTLSEQVNKATQLGYTNDFEVKSYGIVSNNGKVFTSDQTKIINFYRFEGYSDPDDSSVLYLIETNDGTQGKIIDAYGANADSNVTEFLGEVDEIHKM